MSDISALEEQIRNFNWHEPSWDLFILGFWVVASIIYAFAAGRGRTLSILVSVYIAKLLVIEAPFLGTQLTSRFNFSAPYIEQLATFVILFLVLFLFLGRFAFRSSLDGKQVASIIFGILFAVLQIGLLISIVLGFLPGEMQNTLTPLVQTLFISQPAPFVWMVLPIIYLIILGKFLSDRAEV